MTAEGVGGLILIEENFSETSNNLVKNQTNDMQIFGKAMYGLTEFESLIVLNNETLKFS